MSTPSIHLFVSWAHHDAQHKKALMRDLRVNLSILDGVSIECWQDQDLFVGEPLVEEVGRAIDGCDYGLLLLSPAYFASRFIADHELPRFVGDTADRPMIPVMLGEVPLDGTRRLHGVEESLVFRGRGGKAFDRCAGPGRADFTLDLATQIRRRIVHDAAGGAL